MREDEIFLRRTDQLAIQTRRNVDDLADVLGVSRASLYGYRKGQRKVTPKAWLKLEEAERRAGVTEASRALSSSHAQAAEAAGGSEEERQALFEEADEPRVKLLAEILRLRDENAALKTASVKSLEERMGRVESLLEKLVEGLEAKSAPATSLQARGRKIK